MTEVKIITRSVIEAIQNVAGKTKLPLHEPIFFGKEYEYLKSCLDTTYVSTVGKYVETFEKQLIDYTGAKSVIGVINGTSGLQIALMLSGVKNGDEVILPASLLLLLQMLFHIILLYLILLIVRKKRLELMLISYLNICRLSQ